MSKLSIIAIGAAFANYFKAKKAYEEALDEQDTLLQAINISEDYENKRDEQYDELLQDGNDKTDESGQLQSVSIVPIIRVGNLVGSIFTVQLSLVFTNTSSSRNYNITDLKAIGRILGEVIRGYEPTGNYNFLLMAGETKEIQFAGAKASLDGKTLQELKDTICAVAGKSLITSCPKTKVDGIGSADVEFRYGSGTTYAGYTKATYRGTKGIVRYCGESFYPNENL